MDDRRILLLSKDITLDFLRKIGAGIKESDGLYYVEIPKESESIFGSTTKRITFDYDVADTHSCELVVPGSNFLAIILDAIKKQAPVVSSRLRGQKGHPKDPAEMITVHNCKAALVGQEHSDRLAIRFYFNISIKGLKRLAVLRPVDIDLETTDVLDFPSEMQLDNEAESMEYHLDDQQVGNSYGRATEFLSQDIKPLVQKCVGLTLDDQAQDIDSINQTYESRVGELRSDVRVQEEKLAEFHQKISHAKTPQSKENYKQQRSKQNAKVQKAEKDAKENTARLATDMKIQIEQARKRYKPLVEFALVGAHVYSYDASSCTVEFKNNTSNRQITADFVEQSGYFTVLCDVCHSQSDKVHLCMHLHICCDNCSEHCIKCKRCVCASCKSGLNPCYICREMLCHDCTASCNFCSGTSCHNHLFVCTHCSESMCYFCSDDCQVCHARFCDRFIGTCGKCKRRVCESDSSVCAKCDLRFCPDDINTCPICREKHCMSDASRCGLCEQSYSKDCVDGKICTTCGTMRPLDMDDSDLQKVLREDPDLARFSKWEGSSNDRITSFKAKKTLRNRIIIYDKMQGKIILDKKSGWL